MTKSPVTEPLTVRGPRLQPSDLGLEWAVQCKSTYPFFETIAAFNSRSVAERYLRDCATANPDFTYQLKGVAL